MNCHHYSSDKNVNNPSELLILFVNFIFHVPRINPKWLSSVVPRRKPFLPQMNDEVVYLKLGMLFIIL